MAPLSYYIDIVLNDVCPHYNTPRYNSDMVIMLSIIAPDIVAAKEYIFATFVNVRKFSQKSIFSGDKQIKPII